MRKFPHRVGKSAEASWRIEDTLRIITGPGSLVGKGPGVSGIGSVDSAQDESGVDVSPTSSDLARRRYQVTMAASEKTKMMVEMALISGVMPRRSRPQISRGRVLSRPIRKKLTAISSIDRVKISKAAPMIERSFFLRTIEFLQAGKHFRGGHRDESRTVAEDDGQQT